MSDIVTHFQLLCVVVMQFLIIQNLRTIHHDLNVLKGIGMRLEKKDEERHE